METQEKKTRTRKLSVLKIKDYLFVALLIAAVFCIISLIGGDFPFGEKTLLESDSYSQIGPFLEYVFDVLAGKQSIFYTASLGGGVEILGTLEYMLLNPFYLISLLAGRANIYKMINFSILAMFIFNGLVFNWFAKKRFKNVSMQIRIILSLTFTFSTFMIFNFGFISWLIMPAILLFIVDAYFEMLDTGKIKRFVIFTIWYVVSSIATGIATTIVLFALFVGYILLTKEKGQRKSHLVKLFLAYVISVVACVIIFVPFIYEYLFSNSSSRTAGFLKYPRRINKSYYLTPVLLSGGLLLLSIYKFIKFKPNERQEKFEFYAFVCLLIFSLCDVSSKIISGGYCVGFYSRYFFLFETYLLLVVLGLFNRLEVSNISKEQKLNEESSLDKKFLTVAFYAVSFIFAAFCVVYFLLNENVAKYIIAPLTFSSKITIISILIFILIVLLFLLALFIKKKNSNGDGAFRNFALIILVIFSLINTSVMTHFNNQTSILTTFDNLIEGQNISGYYYLGQSGNFSLKNKTVAGSGNVYYFSSIMKANTVSGLKSIGEKAGANFVSSENDIIFSASLLGLDHCFSEQEQDRPYLSLVSSENNCFLYKNELATTGAIVIGTDFAPTYDEGSTWGLYEQFKDYYGISGELYEQLLPELQDVENIDDEGCLAIKKVSITPDHDGILYFTNGTEDLKLRLKTGEETLKDEIKIHMKDDGFGLFDLAFIRAGETLDLYMVISDEYSEIPEIKFTFLNYSVAEQICHKFQESQVQKTIKKGGFEARFTLGENEKVVIFNVDNSGMFYTLDGQEISVSHVLGDFVCISAEAGTHVLQASYHAPYLKAWILIALIGIVLIAVLLVINKKWENKAVEQIISVAMIGAFWLILSLLVVAGPILTIIELII